MPEDIDAELAAIREKVSKEVTLLEAHIHECRVRVDSLRTTLRGLDEVLGLETDHPQGSEAVRRVASEADHWLTISEILEELVRRGWAPDSDKPEGAVRASAARLRAADCRWKMTEGRLVFSEDIDDETLMAMHDQARDELGEEDA